MDLQQGLHENGAAVPPDTCLAEVSRYTVAQDVLDALLEVVKRW